MPNQRAADQKQLPVRMDERLIDIIDSALSALNYSTRTDFIKDALIEKLRRDGVPVPDRVGLPPSRIRKRNSRHPIAEFAGLALNDGPVNSEAVASVAPKILKNGLAGLTPDAKEGMTISYKGQKARNTRRRKGDASPDPGAHPDKSA